MLLQWCLKGVPETEDFQPDDAAEALKNSGLSSAWLRDKRDQNLLPALDNAHGALSQAALDDHVNGFHGSSATTPYISLTAGIVTIDPSTGASCTHSALSTAVSFATGAIWDQGRQRHPGFVFKVWVLVAPKPGPELPGFAEEVRDLNLFSDFDVFHCEGEIAAKLVVPNKQILSVRRYEKNGTVDSDVDWTEFGLHQPARDVTGYCPEQFVEPERVTNLRDLVE